MRDPKRIREFCNELADIWEANCPDWRFGQLLVNVIVRDPFYLEERDMLRLFREYFYEEGLKREKSNAVENRIARDRVPDYTGFCNDIFGDE